MQERRTSSTRLPHGREEPAGARGHLRRAPTKASKTLASDPLPRSHGAALSSKSRNFN